MGFLGCNSFEKIPNAFPPKGANSCSNPRISSDNRAPWESPLEQHEWNIATLATKWNA
jgi:hypothetical protein